MNEKMNETTSSSSNIVTKIVIRRINKVIPKKPRKLISDKNCPWKVRSISKAQRSARKKFATRVRESIQQYSRKNFLDEYKTNLQNFVEKNPELIQKLKGKWIATHDKSVENFTSTPLDENKMSWSRILYEVVSKQVTLLGLVNNKKKNKKYVNLPLIICENEETYSKNAKLTTTESASLSHGRIVVDKRVKNGFEVLEPMNLAKHLIK